MADEAGSYLRVDSQVWFDAELLPRLGSILKRNRFEQCVLLARAGEEEAALAFAAEHDWVRGVLRSDAEARVTEENWREARGTRVLIFALEHDLSEASWRELAATDCVVKLTGFRPGAAAVRGFVQSALSHLGPGRLMFGSNWPLDLPDCTWKQSLAYFTQALGAQPQSLREQILGGNANRIYRVSSSSKWILL